MTDKIRILGIDPGSRITGFGVLDFEDDCARYVASGSIRSGTGNFSARLQLIFRSIGEIVGEYKPDAAVIETIFVHRNAMSALKLGQARSAALCATFASELALYEYAPREIKQAVVGSGAATKEQVQHMVISILRLKGAPSPDAADALAAALCHGHQRRLHSRLAGAAASAGRS